ncbi:MAG TPA: HNH endonuclease [Polyangiaceae bacterium]|nr:HNH endonuclease [Polyangiaceae bacterium]
MSHAARDGLCCTFTSADGQRCSARAFLQIHHEHAWAKGGSDTLDNLRLLCGSHNRLLAELEFGKRHAG